MSNPTLTDVITAGDRILLDTATLLAYLNGNELVSPLAALIIDDFVRTGRNEAIVSMVTVMEVLVRPLRLGTGLYRHLIDFLRNFPNLRPVEIDLVVAQEAAALRATHGFSTPDALIVGTGLVAQVSQVVTNDAAWRTKLRPISNRMGVCYLKDFA